MSSNKGATLDDAIEKDGQQHQGAPPGYTEYQTEYAQYHSKQQVGTAPLGVVVNQPQVVPSMGGVNQTVIIQQGGGKTWSTSLFSCTSDMKSCCLVTWCGPCYECWFHSKNNESCCTPMCVPGASIALRTKIRTQNNILGSIIDDCCMACLCGPCTLCQMKREYDIIQMEKDVTTVTTTQNY
ncbi:unnamed protein product [Owenia fusiformis]|uniref:Uncharacterized protein n=1 Tax=Owenia fusiformis TaxID=6347 RepID=A0A8J1UIB4_OWEFU|nr:unnamed protein product [Owenia fusiformis]